MILVADSGSTKCDWKLGDSSNPEILLTHTMGFNPFYHNTDFIKKEISKNAELLEFRNEVTELYYFGAGCSSAARNLLVEEALRDIFVHAKIQVSHDVSASAIATCGAEEGISCILGTGSNSTFFDGKSTFRQMVPALGYILGDEGSGSYLGKRLLSDFLYKRLPTELHAFLKDEMALNKELIFEKTYAEHANVYLASFAKVLSDFKTLDYVQNLVRKGFREFIEIHLLTYPELKKVKVHFICSVAYYFQEELKEVCADYEIEVSKVIKQPIHDLMSHYLRQ